MQLIKSQYSRLLFMRKKNQSLHMILKIVIKFTHVIPVLCRQKKTGKNSKKRSTIYGVLKMKKCNKYVFSFKLFFNYYSLFLNKFFSKKSKFSKISFRWVARMLNSNLQFTSCNYFLQISKIFLFFTRQIRRNKERVLGQFKNIQQNTTEISPGL